MTDVLIRGVKPDAVKRLKEKAKKNGRSFQSEAKQILEKASGESKVMDMLKKWQTHFAGKKLTSSVDLIREDRER